MNKAPSLLKVLKEFEALTSLRYQEITSHLPKDSIPVGFFCPYVPEELLHAAGALPFRLMDTPTKISHAQAYLPPYCCHLIKSFFESLLQGELNFLKGVIFSHTCDAMQGFSDIWAHQERFPFHFNLMIPTNLDSDHSRAYLRAEIERFRDFLELHFGKISPQTLKDSIQLFNRIRDQLEKLYIHRHKSHPQISGSDFGNIIRAGYLMDRQRYLELLNGLLNELTEKTDWREYRVPIYLSGNMTHSASWLSLIEESGVRVVQDDLCSGGRTLRLRVPEHPDPIEALVQRYFASFFCPTKYMGAKARLETLLKEVQNSGAKGVIFLLYKYCEPHHFDYPDLKLALESKEIPTLFLEVEDPSQGREQLKIRIQAFIEMLNPV